jgi:hypothetical protein
MLEFRRHRRNRAFLLSRTRGTKCLTAHRTGTVAALRCGQRSPEETEDEREGHDRRGLPQTLGPVKPAFGYVHPTRYLSEVDTLFANRKVSGLFPFSLPRIIVSVLQRSTGLEGLNSCNES